MVARDVVRFRGHPEVRATHPKTIELTKEDDLTARGDCIAGVGADAAAVDLSDNVKRGIREGKRVRFTLTVGTLSFVFRGWGDPRLELSSKKDLVIRRSNFVCTRTVAVRAEASASDLPRDITRSLSHPHTVGELAIEVED